MDDYKIFRAAHEKDYGPLIELLQSDAELLPRHRELVVKILEGKLRRPSHRKAGTLKDLRRKQAIAKHVRDLEREGWKLTAAVAHAADEFNCSEGTVKNARRHEREGESVHKLIKDTSALLRRRAEEDGHPGVMLSATLEFEEAAAKIYQEVGLKHWHRPRILWDETNK